MTDGPGEHHPRKGFLYALVGVALISTNFVTAKYAMEGFNVETFSFVWTSVAAGYSLLIVAGMGLLPRVKPAGRGSCGMLLLMGIFTAADMVFGWAGLQRLDPSFNAFLRREGPLFIILLGVVFLRERLRAAELAPMALMLVGGALSVIGRWGEVGAGVLFTVAGDVAAGFLMLVAKVESRRTPPAVMVLWRLTVGAALIGVWAFGFGHVDFNVPFRYWAVLFLGALLGPCLAHVAIFQAYRHWSLSRCTMLLMIQPLLVLPLAWAFLGKLPFAQGFAGGLLILAGAAWMTWMHFVGSKATAEPPMAED